MIKFIAIFLMASFLGCGSTVVLRHLDEVGNYVITVGATSEDNALHKAERICKHGFHLVRRPYSSKEGNWYEISFICIGN